MAYTAECAISDMRYHLPSLKRPRAALYRHALTRDKTMQDALERLRTLTDLEARAVAAETQVVAAETRYLVAEAHFNTTDTRDAVYEMQAVLKRMSSEITMMYQGISFSLFAMKKYLLIRIHVNRASTDAARRTSALFC